MSLVGNLEDLGLGDILQIVSLSRKSGELHLKSRGREGKVVFRNGQVIQASSSVFKENLGDLLLRMGKVSIDVLKKALLVQRNKKPLHRIGAILVDDFGLSKPVIDEIVKDQIERIVYSFFGWTEGSFAFELGEPEEQGATHFDPLQFMLDQGLNPQWLAMEGSRLYDEMRHRGESLEPPAFASSVNVDQLIGADDRQDQQVIPSPTTAQSPPAAGSLFNLGAELSAEFDVPVGSTHGTRIPESPGLYLLRGMLQELHNPSLGGGIILLVLRFASELMNRAIVFLVKENVIVGLGQFGIQTENGNPDQRVRETVIPRNQPSLLLGPFQEMRSIKVSPTDSKLDRYLFEQLGGGRPGEIFLGPIISEGKIVAILYGDNLPEDKPIGDTEALEIFLSQAGLAMEKALLERRLRGRES